MEKTYKMAILPRILFCLVALAIGFLIVPIPLSLMLLSLVFKGEITISSEKVSLWWLGRRETRWSDMEFTSHGTSTLLMIFAGVFVKEILIYKVKGERFKRKIPYKFFQNSAEIRSEFEKYASANKLNQSAA